MSSTASSDDAAIFQVSGSMAFFSWLICEHPGLWKKIGQIESSIVADSIDSIVINKPIYVAGLARSGSTILLEILNQVPGVISHCYKDFPPVYTPYAWNMLLRQMASGTAKPAERAHKDGILVTEDSPEAMEEPLWMSFFPFVHDPLVSNVIGPEYCSTGADHGFGAFYQNHVRKLLAVRQGERYLAKGNYQITRLEYLLQLLPEPKFVLPVRDPAAHIASLVKQHDLFTRGQRANKQARQHLRRVGHYEFGLDRVPINTGNTELAKQVLELWAGDNELLGWARYWNMIYGYLADRLEANPGLAQAAKIIIFEDLCQQPADILGDLFRHCGLQVSADFAAGAAARIKAPSYYQSGFNHTELAMIATETAATMERIRKLAGQAGD